MTQQLRYSGLVALAGAVGVALVASLSVSQAMEPATRNGALTGVLIAMVTGFAALALKRRAVVKSVNAAMAAVGLLMLGRLVLMGIALAIGSRAGLNSLALVLGFFGEYFVLQAIEIRYAISVLKGLQVTQQVQQQKGAA